MKCPKCNKEIDHVIVVSTCSQEGTLEGNEITEYSSPSVEETQEILCSECLEIITEHVQEE